MPFYQEILPVLNLFCPRSLLLTVIYKHTLNVIPPIPALLRFPQPRNAHQEAAQIGQWILADLRELIATIASASEDNRLIRKILAGLRRVCHLGKKADHTFVTSQRQRDSIGTGMQ